MKIKQAIYGIKSGSKIQGYIVKPEQIEQGKKFIFELDPFPGKRKVLFVKTENDVNGIEHEFIFKSNDIVEFDFSTDNCPTCKGSGKVTSKFITHSNGIRTEEEFQATCMTCDGEPVSKQQGLALQKSIIAEEKKWCKCETDTDS